MKIVYMGTPEIAVPCLRFLAESGHDVVGVFTQPDRPKGRGHHTISPPIKVEAESYGIPVFQPVSLRKGEDALKAIETLRALVPDCIVVMAYGQILPQEILDLPPYHCINLHASLLPKYRGAAPIQYAILNGETETGMTSMLMAEGLDTGDMLVQKELEIPPEETADELSQRLSELAAVTLQETLVKLENGTLVPVPQKDDEATMTGRIPKEMSELDFSRSAVALHNVIRAITGYTTLDGKRLKVYASRVVENTSDTIPGTILDSEKFIIACGEKSALQLIEVQPEGKRRMHTSEFLCGRKLTYGEVVGK